MATSINLFIIKNNYIFAQIKLPKAWVIQIQLFEFAYFW
jgi:hypothetical protein